MRKISASIMCIDFVDLFENIKQINNYIDYIHIDIMDGLFVPNITFGFYQVNALRKITSKPFDIHLMIKEPEKHFDKIIIKPNDIVSIHFESTNNIEYLIKKIHSMNALACIAINPETSIQSISKYLSEIDCVLIMTVNPGFAGQKLVPMTLLKIEELKSLINQTNNKHIKIQVDGNVSYENALKMKELGADIFVVGTSSVFSSSDFIANLNRFKEVIS